MSSDISRLYSEWQKKEFGKDNGKDMFDKLELEISTYNDRCINLEGKAAVQCFQGTTDSSTDSDSNEELPPKKKRRKKGREKPLIIAVCTPLMSRVHKHIQQAGELIFCDSTSSLDRFNTSLFIISTSHPAGGMPLAVLITSDEQEDTLVQGLNLLKKVVPLSSFYGRGSTGPQIIMTDDSTAERNALQHVWPNSHLLLCSFHFLQRKWSWLHDGQNCILNEDRSKLIKLTKMLVYADSEAQLHRLYDQFKKDVVVRKYPRYLQYIESQWERRKEWALCYRKHLLVRGNHTNNYAEAGMRILKDLVFSRVKAYNLVQMFSFVTEFLELYYSRKILSVAHNRFEHHTSLKFQGINCSKISRNHITALDEGTFLVDSMSEREVKYLVDTNLGVCSCTAGQDGSPCSHQAAIVRHLHISSLNCIPTLSPETRKYLAFVAVGHEATQDSTFYSSIHQKSETISTSPSSSTNFDDTSWQLVQSLAHDPDQPSKEENEPTPSSSRQCDVKALLEQFSDFSTDITSRVKESTVVAEGMEIFLKRYQNMTSSGKFSNARLASALHRFGWVFGGTVRSTQGGYLRRGRRIPVNAQAAGRRRKLISKGKAKALPGRPRSIKPATYSVSRYNMHSRKQAPGKRPHSLKENIAKGTQNAGKW